MTMRHRIHFKYDSSPDGQVDPTYDTFLAFVPCNVIDSGGREKYRGLQLQAETTHLIDTRFYQGLKPNMIIVNAVSNVEYTINRINDPKGRQRRIIIEAIEVVV